MGKKAGLTRRRFLGQVGGLYGAGLVGAGALRAWATGAEAQEDRVPPEAIGRLSEHLFVHAGPINVGILRDGAKALLIDVGDGSVADTLGKLQISTVDQVLFTHHHRDQACGLGRVPAARSARIGAPKDERQWFERPGDYWNADQSDYGYKLHPHRLMLTSPVRVDAEMAPDAIVEWGPARIRVLSTPGHTDGSISYLVEVDGRKVIFSGDVIYDEGKVWNLHAMQKGFRRGEASVIDYHGFMGSRLELLDSLQRIKAAGPEVLVPSHGQVMKDPARAIDLLTERMNACHDKYVQISALRHYFPGLFSEYAGKPGHMAFDKGFAPPDFLRHISTSWIIVSQDGPGLMMDCWNAKVIGEVKKLIESRQITGVEGLWVTHYHNDHTDGLAEAREAFGCPVIADRSVAEIITQPPAWRLPCVPRNATKVDRVTTDGESWSWHEFKLTAYHLPGQTLHHGGLLVEGRGVRMLFAGDSFTPSGIDDYCAYNRNWLGKDVGYDRCLGLIEKLQPTHIFNCHVNNAFTFTPEQLRHMQTNLVEREKMFGELVAWDHANYAMDETWVHCRPYERHVAPGAEVDLLVKVRNHSVEARQMRARLVLPREWKHPVSGWKPTTIPAKADGEAAFKIEVPADVAPGRYVITADVDYDSRLLPQFTEAIIVVKERT